MTKRGLQGGQKVATSEQKVATPKQKLATSEQKVAMPEQKVATAKPKVAIAEQKVSQLRCGYFFLLLQPPFPHTVATFCSYYSHIFYRGLKLKFHFLLSLKWCNVLTNFYIPP